MDRRNVDAAIQGMSFVSGLTGLLETRLFIANGCKWRSEWAPV